MAIILGYVCLVNQLVGQTYNLDTILHDQTHNLYIIQLGQTQLVHPTTCANLQHCIDARMPLLDRYLLLDGHLLNQPLVHRSRPPSSLIGSVQNIYRTFPTIRPICVSFATAGEVICSNAGRVVHNAHLAVLLGGGHRFWYYVCAVRLTFLCTLVCP